MSQSRSSFESRLDRGSEESLRSRCLRQIKTLDSFDFFQEYGPKTRLEKLIRNLQPCYEKSLKETLPRIEGLYHAQILKVKNLEDIRRYPGQTDITFQDQLQTGYRSGSPGVDSRASRKQPSAYERPICAQEETEGDWAAVAGGNYGVTAGQKERRKAARTVSSPRAFQQKWLGVDKDLRDSYLRQTENLFTKVFYDSCKALMVEHPMLESALDQILSIEEENRLRAQFQGSRDHLHAGSASSTSRRQPRFQKSQSTTGFANRFGSQASGLSGDRGFGSGMNVGGRGSSHQAAAVTHENINVHLDLKSYQQHSEMMKEIQASYEGLMQENTKLRERLNKLKAAHDKETNVMKHTQFVQADRDMKVLQEHRLKRNKSRLGVVNDKSDEALDEVEAKTVPVEFFDALEGIDESLRNELNYKLARVRNSFQELLDLNLKTVNKLETRIKLMNELSPEAYSIANLSLVEIFLGIAKKESDPGRVWRALNRSYGEDYFIAVVEEQYGKRFVANYNALYNEVNKVKELADAQFAETEKIYQIEVQAQKKISQSLRQELALYRENFKEQVLAIQEQTKVSLEKDFEAREAKNYQEQLRKEAETQKEIDERDALYSLPRQTIEKLHLRRAFDKLKMIKLAKEARTVQSSENDLVLNAILGFLKGSEHTDRQAIEEEYKGRINELINDNSDLCEQARQLDLKNTLLEDQVKLIEAQISDVGAKVASAEARQQIAYEERRKSMADIKAFQQINKNLESIIESHEREKQRLVLELKRFTKQKVRQNVLEAELHRKQKQTEIIKRGNQVVKKIYVGVDSHKTVQTDIGGLKGHLVYLNEEEYHTKFGKTFEEAQTQTTAPYDQGDSLEAQSRQTAQNTLDVGKSSTSSRNQNLRAVGGSSRKLHHKSGSNAAKQGQSNHYGQGISGTGERALLRSQSGIDTKNGSSRRGKDSATLSDEGYMASGPSKRTLNQSEDQNPSKPPSSRASRSGSRKGSTEPPISVTRKHSSSNLVDVGVSCELILPEWSPNDKRSPGRKGLNNAMLKKKDKSKQHLSESNMSQDGLPSQSFTKMNPLFSQRADVENDPNTGGGGAYGPETAKISNMPTLQEDSMSGDGGDSDNEVVDLEMKGTMLRGVSIKHFVGSSKKGGLKGKKNSMSVAQEKKLAAGWKIVNERLRDIQAMEQRNKSQIKYEVDKAFEMAKYLDDTNFSSRDPATTQAYTSMVQMCMSNLDQLTPFMILQKLEHEKNNLQKLLSVDPAQAKQNSSSVAKILNFVCLENLNNQILSIFNQVIRQSLPPSISDVKRNASDDGRKSAGSIQIVDNNQSRSALVNSSLSRDKQASGLGLPVANTQKVTTSDSLFDQGGLLLAQGKSIDTPRVDQNLSRQNSTLGLAANSLTTGAGMHQHSSLTHESPTQASNYLSNFGNHIRNQAFFPNGQNGTSSSNQRNAMSSHQLADQLHRRSLESMLTVKSSSQTSNAVNKYSASFPKVQEQDTETIVKNLISDKRNLRTKIEQTFQSNNQKAAAVEARVSAAKRFNTKSFQSLLTSNKFSGQQTQDKALRNSQQEKRQYMQYREKMRNFMNPSQSSGLHTNPNQPAPPSSNGTKSSNLFKNVAARTSTSDFHKSITSQDPFNHTKQSLTIYQEPNAIGSNFNKESKDQIQTLARPVSGGLRHFDEQSSIQHQGKRSFGPDSNEPSGLDPELLRQGRRTAETRLTKGSQQAMIYQPLDPSTDPNSAQAIKQSMMTRTVKKGSGSRATRQAQYVSQQFRQTSDGFFPRSQNQPDGSNMMVQNQEASLQPNSSYLDYVKTSGNRKRDFEERNAYLNQETTKLDSFSHGPNTVGPPKSTSVTSTTGQHVDARSNKALQKSTSEIVVKINKGKDKDQSREVVVKREGNLGSSSEDGDQSDQSDQGERVNANGVELIKPMLMDRIKLAQNEMDKIEMKQSHSSYLTQQPLVRLKTSSISKKHHNNSSNASKDDVSRHHTQKSTSREKHAPQSASAAQNPGPNSGKRRTKNSSVRRIKGTKSGTGGHSASTGGANGPKGASQKAHTTTSTSLGLLIGNPAQTGSATSGGKRPTVVIKNATVHVNSSQHKSEK